MGNIKLCPLSLEDGHDVYEMLQRIERYENDFNNEAFGMTYEEYKEWLDERNAWSKGERLPEGYVKQWIFFLKVDYIPVGIGKIRERVTTESAKWGGNIGFAIDPWYRGRGYGTQLFRLLLEEAKKLEVKEVYSTVRKTNFSSIRVHEKCCGKLMKEDDNTCYYVF